MEHHMTLHYKFSLTQSLRTYLLLRALLLLRAPLLLISLLCYVQWQSQHLLTARHWKIRQISLILQDLCQYIRKRLSLAELISTTRIYQDKQTNTGSARVRTSTECIKKGRTETINTETINTEEKQKTIKMTNNSATKLCSLCWMHLCAYSHNFSSS